MPNGHHDSPHRGLSPKMNPRIRRAGPPSRLLAARRWRLLSFDHESSRSSPCGGPFPDADQAIPPDAEAPPQWLASQASWLWGFPLDVRRPAPAKVSRPTTSPASAKLVQRTDSRLRSRPGSIVFPGNSRFAGRVPRTPRPRPRAWPLASRSTGPPSRRRLPPRKSSAAAPPAQPAPPRRPRVSARFPAGGPLPILPKHPRTERPPPRLMMKSARRPATKEAPPVRRPSPQRAPPVERPAGPAEREPEHCREVQPPVCPGVPPVRLPSAARNAEAARGVRGARLDAPSASRPDSPRSGLKTARRTRRSLAPANRRLATEPTRP